MKVTVKTPKEKEEFAVPEDSSVQQVRTAPGSARVGVAAGPLPGAGRGGFYRPGRGSSPEVRLSCSPRSSPRSPQVRGFAPWDAAEACGGASRPVGGTRRRLFPPRPALWPPPPAPRRFPAAPHKGSGPTVWLPAGTRLAGAWVRFRPGCGFVSGIKRRGGGAYCFARPRSKVHFAVRSTYIH